MEYIIRKFDNGETISLLKIDGSVDFISLHKKSLSDDKCYNPFNKKIMGLVENSISKHHIEITEESDESDIKLVSIEVFSGSNDITVYFDNEAKTTKLYNDGTIKSIGFVIVSKSKTPITYIRFRTEVVYCGEEETFDWDLIIAVCVSQKDAERIGCINLIQADLFDLQNLTVEVAFKEDESLKYIADDAYIQQIEMAGDNFCLCKFSCRYAKDSRFNFEIWLRNNTDLDTFSFTKNLIQPHNLILSCLSNGNGLSCFWQQLSDAVLYTVEVYRCVSGIFDVSGIFRRKRNNQWIRPASGTIQLDLNSGKKIYVMNLSGAIISDMMFMLKKHICSEQCYFSLSDLPAGSYFVRVFAENCQGNIIMKTSLKGIVTYPVICPAV